MHTCLSEVLLWLEQAILKHIDRYRYLSFGDRTYEQRLKNIYDQHAYNIFIKYIEIHITRKTYVLLL
jgi:hypothetical protein